MPMNTRYLVAEDGVNGEFLGGAYVTAHQAGQGGLAASFQLAVDEAHADEVGPLLLAGCVAQARAVHAEVLSYDGMVPEGAPTELLLKAHAFKAVQTLTNYVMDTRTACEVIDSTWRRLERRGGIPSSGRAVALREAALGPVREIIARHLGPPMGLDWQAPGSTVLADVSSVVLLGPRLVGALIVRDFGGQAEAPYDVVDEEFRGGWATAALWRRSFHKGIEAGYEIVRFRTNDTQFKSFANFARRMKAAPLGREFRYVLPLEPGSDLRLGTP